MKQNPKIKLMAIVIVVLSLLVCMSACSAKTDIGNVDDLTEEFIDLMLENNYNKAYELVKNSGSRNDFKPYWDAMRSTAKDATDYEMEQIGWNISTNDGKTYRTAAFEVELNNGRTIFLRTTVVSGVEGISGIFFNDITEFNATYGLFADIASIVLIVFSLLVAAFTVWMLIDCIRRKISKKALWIILILLCFSFSLTIGQQFALNVGVGVFVMPSSAAADPALLSLTVKMILPIGALIYFFIRKHLKIKENPPQNGTNAVNPNIATNPYQVPPYNQGNPYNQTPPYNQGNLYNQVPQSNQVPQNNQSTPVAPENTQDGQNTAKP